MSPYSRELCISGFWHPWGGLEPILSRHGGATTFNNLCSTKHCNLLNPLKQRLVRYILNECQAHFQIEGKKGEREKEKKKETDLYIIIGKSPILSWVAKEAFHYLQDWVDWVPSVTWCTFYLNYVIYSTIAYFLNCVLY